MRIVAFQIENFKSFYSTPEIKIDSPGLTVIVGQNNAGKTALVQALSIDRLTQAPHKSLKTVRQSEAHPLGRSTVHITFEFAGYELRGLLPTKEKVANLYLPTDHSLNREKIREFYALLEHGTFRVRYSLEDRQSVKAAELVGFTDPEQYTTAFGINFDAKTPDEIEHVIRFASAGQVNKGFLIPDAIYARVVQRIYLLNAERLNVGEAPYTAATELQPDGGNLPQVLQNLTIENPPRFARFMEYVKRVFPEIRLITIPALRDRTGNQIRIWSFDTDLEREDLTVPLAESGTGIGQVLTILYIIVSSITPKVIIIDEPQSFLHPAAIRKLFEILKENSQHQYIVTTHSPIIISAAEVQTILLVRKNGWESTITTLNPNKLEEAEIVLMEVGARLSDVFGADNILWVEGHTEEVCFPKILSAIAKQPLNGTVIKGVLHTGDFEKKNRRHAVQVYSRLSQGGGVVPPAFDFVFDRESHDESFFEELRKISGKKIRVLKRRMYENYLLNPTAIATVMSSLENFSDTPVSAAGIEDWIASEGWKREFINVVDKEKRTSEYWRYNVDAARLLDVMFSHFSKNGYRFQKTVHAVALTDWLIENEPNELQEIADLLVDILVNVADPKRA
jgi:energy-coupling factor transporter ATP-binding protein EcfA2